MLILKTTSKISQPKSYNEAMNELVHGHYQKKAIKKKI